MLRALTWHGGGGGLERRKGDRTVVEREAGRRIMPHAAVEMSGDWRLETGGWRLETGDEGR